nr:MAG TPA: hypothetical protein [Caudoviricetes sp.]
MKKFKKIFDEMSDDGALTKVVILFRLRMG